MLVSVAAIALAAGSTVALSQGSGGGSGSGGGAAGGGAGGNTPMANPSAPSGGQDTTAPSPRGTKGAQDQKSTQSPTSGQGTTNRQTQGEQPTKSQQTQSPSTGGAKQGASDQKSGTKQGANTGSTGSSNVSLTSEQKTTIRNTVLTSGPKVTNVNFDVRVGTVIPRTVRIAPLPATIVEIQPAWRGYMYFVYSDEIVVVEPGTLRIVAVLDV